MSFGKTFHDFFDFTHRITVLLYQFIHFQLKCRVINRQQSPRMSHIQQFVLQPHLNFSRQFQQTQIISDSRPFLTYPVAQPFLSQIILFDQFLKRQCDFDRIQIFPLNIFYQRHLHHRLILCCTHISRNSFKAGHDRSPVTTLPGNDLISSVWYLT